VMKEKKVKKNVESGPSSDCAGVDLSPMVMDTWGGLHGADKALVKTIFTKVTADLAPTLRRHAVDLLRNGLGVQLARAVAGQL